MKFIVFFIVSCIALAATGEEPPTVTKEQLQHYFENVIVKYGVNCRTYENTCVDFIKISDRELERSLVQGCINMYKQYFCEGKKTGKAFDDVYKLYNELQKMLSAQDD